MLSVAGAGTRRPRKLTALLRAETSRTASSQGVLIAAEVAAGHSLRKAYLFEPGSRQVAERYLELTSSIRELGACGCSTYDRDYG